MDKAKTNHIKKYISWICLAALVAWLAVMPLMAAAEDEADGPVASILSGTVDTGSITTGINTGGTLTSQTAVEVVIPTGVKITEFLVSNGDLVKAGDPLATIDRVTVMTTIASVQETMDYLIEEMSDVTDESADTKITAEAGGLVKIIYAQEGDSVQDVMLEHGALAVLSLDGLMAVQIHRNTELITGDSVTVIFEDETTVTGRVDSNMDGILEVTVEDEGYVPGTKVVVTTQDGKRIGSGELYVHNAWNAVAYTGTVSKINTAIDKNLSAGATLITLTDTEFNASLESFLSQYADYEELMLELFQMYQQDAITAPCDGMISGVEEDSVHLLASSGPGYRISLLANAPDGNDQASYINYVGMVTGIDKQGNWSLALNPQEQAVTDYTDLSGVSTDPAAMTKVAVHIPTAPIYEYTAAGWVSLQASDIGIGDTLLFACNEEGSFVWVVRIAVGSGSDVPDASEPSTPTQPEETPDEPTTEPSTSPDTEGTDPTEPSTDDTPQSGIVVPGGSGNFGGMSSNFGGTTQEETFELFDLSGNVLMTVTPQETMTLSVSIDEQDISKVQLGMSADVSVTALKNQSFTATVTEIGSTGSNNGGSSKFTLELTMDREENMLDGMNAVVTIPLDTVKDIPVIPVEALVDMGSKTVVYTGYDEKNGVLTDPVEVTLGVSDGILVQILSGLETGDAYWYSYYDTLQLDHSVDRGFSFP